MNRFERHLRKKIDKYITKYRIKHTMKLENMELRYAGELRLAKDSRTVTGLAIPVNSQSELLGDFREVVDPAAINQDLINNNDIKLFANHDASRGTLGRSNHGQGSLHLSITNRGLEFSCDLPHTPLADEIIEGISRRDYSGVSFAFFVDHDEWQENPDGTYLRTIKSYKMLDEISILSCKPAYSATENTIAMRSLEAFKKSQEEKRAEDKAEEEKKKAEAEAKKAEEEKLAKEKEAEAKKAEEEKQKKLDEYYSTKYKELDS